MPEAKDFQPVFDRLRQVMASIESECVVLKDEAGKYCLDMPPVPWIAKDLWLGSVEIKKNYVSFHYMPVYAAPQLLEGLSEGLKKRMQGKSCFNFKKIDETLFEELAALVARGLPHYRAYVEAQKPAEG